MEDGGRSEEAQRRPCRQQAAAGAAQKFGSTSVTTPSCTFTVSRSGPATHW